MRPRSFFTFFASILVVLAVALDLSCSGAGDGSCTRASDCPGGQSCHPQLGCVPDGEGGDGDADADSDADADADTDADADADADADPAATCDELRVQCAGANADACRLLDEQCGAGSSCAPLRDACRDGTDQACALLLELCPEEGQTCDALRASCDAGDAQACALLEQQGCAVNAPCGADGACDPECGPDDPDCADPALCPESCGVVPEVSREDCVWTCEGADGGCVLANRAQPLLETCIPPDGQVARDEDCDGLADCLDPDCEGTDACR